MTTFEQIDSIVTRHHADREEADLLCRACGRPWPCDVQQLAAALSTGTGSMTAVLADRDRGWRTTRRSRVRSEALVV